MTTRFYDDDDGKVKKRWMYIEMRKKQEEESFLGPGNHVKFSQ